jgi:hypothetical protein
MSLQCFYKKSMATSLTMPTLINQTESTSAILDGETADTAGCMWLSEHLLNRKNVAPLDSIGVRPESMENTNRSAGAMIGDETQMLLGVVQPKIRSSNENIAPKVPLRSHQSSIADFDSDSDRTLSFSEARLQSPKGLFNIGADRSSLSNNLSRTYDDEDLVLRRLECFPNKTVLEEVSNRRTSLASSNYIEKINERSEPLSLHCVNNASHDTKNCTRCKKLASPDGQKIGFNECIYMQQYHPHISNAIVSFCDKYPGKLPNYTTLTHEKKMVEQMFVMDLLQRLGISSSTVGDQKMIANEGAGHNRADPSLNVLQHVSITRAVPENEMLSESSVDLLSPPPRRSPMSTTPEIPESESLPDSSVDLLSLPPGRPPSNFSPIAPAGDVSASLALRSPPCQEIDDSSSTQSIEIARSAVPFDSPNLSRYEKKRLASTSGKRGADMSRVRLEDMDAPTPSKFLLNSIDRLSLMDDNNTIFSSSQSPIVAYSPYSPMQQNHGSSMESIASDISFGDDDDRAVCVRPMYDNDSIVETAMLPDKRVHWDFDGKLAKEAPTDVRLVDGETMRWPKLPTEHRQRTASPTQTFSDPFIAYAEPLLRHLEKLYTWILRRDQTNSSLVLDRYAAVLSITFQYVIDVIVKLHLEHPYMKDLTFCNHQLPLHGNTLIVTRSKEELDLLKRSFREGSALSVLNHASLPMSQRKSQSCAEKSVHFDVVLSTYDSLKSPDVALKLDRDGFAITTASKSDDGWFTSSSSSASQHVDQIERNCKQLSALHRVHWRRLILVDVLGRKSFLSKLDTARVKAVRAVNADSRLAFFVSSDDDTISGIQALIKSDRTALSSLASVLRMERDEADMTSLLDNVVMDFSAMSSSTHTKQYTKKNSQR